MWCDAFLPTASFELLVRSTNKIGHLVRRSYMRDKHWEADAVRHLPHIFGIRSGCSLVFGDMVSFVWMLPRHTFSWWIDCYVSVSVCEFAMGYLAWKTCLCLLLSSTCCEHFIAYIVAFAGICYFHGFENYTVQWRTMKNIIYYFHFIFIDTKLLYYTSMTLNYTYIILYV